MAVLHWSACYHSDRTQYWKGFCMPIFGMFYLYRSITSFHMFHGKRIIEVVFLSVLDNGDVIYKQVTVSTLTPLDSIYHSALRSITSDCYSSHHCILYEVSWAPLTVRRHWFMFLFKTWMSTCLHQLSIQLVTESLFNALQWLYNATSSLGKHEICENCFQFQCMHLEHFITYI